MAQSDACFIALVRILDKRGNENTYLESPIVQMSVDREASCRQYTSRVLRRMRGPWRCMLPEGLGDPCCLH
jgi:hypothetical protein